MGAIGTLRKGAEPLTLLFRLSGGGPGGEGIPFGFCLTSSPGGRMSDMAEDRITLRVPKDLRAELEAEAEARGVKPSVIARKALECWLRPPPPGQSYNPAGSPTVVDTTERPSISPAKRGLFG